MQFYYTGNATCVTFPPMVINSAINSRMHILTLSSSLVASDSSLQQSKGRSDLTHHETCDKHRVQVNPAPDKQ